jgi:hypothetical protein
MKTPIEVVVLVEWQDEKLAEDVAKLMGERQAARTEGKPGAIAAELKTRAAYLRSRPMADHPRLQRWEREVLGELEALEIRARMLEVERKLGRSGPQYLGELAEIERLAFAVRGRFAGLLDKLDEPWPTRSNAIDPKRRAKELEEIERFLAARAPKKAKTTGTDGAGGAR